MTWPARAQTGTVNWQPLRTHPPHRTRRRGITQPRYEACRAASWLLPGRTPDIVRAARAHVTSLCHTWHLPDEVTDPLTLIVSELVTNAVIHARGARITVALMLSSRHVWVSVTDQGHPREPITPRAVGEAAEGGRGLYLVDALATRWHAATGQAGSRVWACVRLPAPAGTPSHPAPSC
ncbi:ATP-binding protein [Streptomyces sp. NPDC001652]|uniref:ATP-binding protein n=1 Tax=Streptomyces sp. NPDC001652 TaxID=3154393 RepID=UPI0033180621